MHILNFKYVGIWVKKFFTQYVNSVFYYVKMPLIYIYNFLKSLIHCLLHILPKCILSFNNLSLLQDTANWI